MKKHYRILLALVAICLLTSCHYPYQDLVKEYHTPSKNESASSELANSSLVPKIDNETPYRDLITKEIDIHEFVQKYCSQDFYYGDTDLEEMANDLGIECLRETEAGALYSIHKVKQGGLLYVFYHNGEGDWPEDDRSTTRCIYVQKKLSSQNFSHIKEGVSIEEVKKIDPVTQVWENLYPIIAPQNAEYCVSIHYLSDGILEIGFQEENGQLKVIASHLSKEYDMPDPRLGISFPYKGLVLDQDRVTD